ncbi:hypothetical protein [Terriglobus sp. RCC_193]|uniref:hypothetical protein n=1 Tax=Terriglobus sp. RCC_193 TaxID=3239218 RepID=UPI0035246B37
MIAVARDLVTLAAAADDFFEEGFQLPFALKVIAETEPEERAEAEEKMLPRRQYADGYYVWLNYLVWLDAVVEMQPQSLSVAELEGLRVLRTARNHFLRTHPSCHACGRPEEATVVRCRHCGAEIK